LAAGFVPTSRTLTINGVTYDLSANRTWTIDTTSATWGNITGVLSNQTDLQTALNSKEPTITAGLISQYWRGDKSWQTLDKTAVGLGNVDNTSDANKPISTATQTALNLKEDKANKGVPNGYASLAGDGKVPSAQLPSYVDDVIEVANFAALPAIGETGVIYITLDNNNVYRWSGSVYVQISQPNAVWGSITGTLSSQTDLQSALNAKQNNITLTTTGTSGAATLIGATLNIPRYDSSLIGYVPYVGAVSDLNLGVHRILAQRGYFENNGSNDTLNVIHSSGSGYGINVSKGGSGEALRVNKTSGSGNAASILGGVTLIDELHLNTDLSDSYIASASNWNSAFNDKINSASVTGTTTKTLTLNQQDGGTITASWTDDNTDAVSSVFGRTGAVVAVSGDYNTSQVTESTNLYYTEARVNANANVAANTAARHNAVTLGTANGLSLSTQQLSLGLASASTTGALSSTDWNTFNNKQGAITLTTTGSSGSATFIGNTLNIPDYSSALIGYVPTSRTITINGVTYDLSTNRAWTIDKASVGLGNVDNTSDLNKPISTATQTALNAKQDDITLTTTGTSGAATLVGSTLNIPQYQSVITNPITGTGTTNYVSKFTGTGSIGDSLIFDNGTNVGIGTSSPTAKLSIGGVGSALSFDTLGASGTTEIKTIQDYELSIKNNRGTSTEILVGNEILKFSTSELERMRITSSGNVGIGTTGPTQKLDVRGTLASIGNGITAAVSFADAAVFGSFSNHDTAFYTNTAEKMRITTGGNVGIGTTSPAYKLNVVTNAVSGRQNLAAIDRTAGNLITFTNPEYSVDASMGLMLRVFPQSDSRQGAGIIASGGSLNGETDLSLFVSSGTASSVSYGALNIKGDTGNVGIGTTSPSTKLEVTGNIKASLSGYELQMYPAWDTGVAGFGTSSNHGLVLSTNNTEKIRITSSGNVGIGTTNPNYKLDVNGDVYFGGNIDIGANGINFYGAGSVLVNRVAPRLDFYGSPSNLSMSITTAGYVGIGTTSPAGALHVATFGQYSYFSSNSGGSSIADVQGLAIGWNKSAGGGETILAFNKGGGATGGLAFSCNDGGSYAEYMRVTSNGNVGIGTTNPTLGKLQVQGNAIFNNATNSTDGIKIISSLSSSLFTGGIEFFRDTTLAGSKIEPLRDAGIGGVGLNLLVTANNSAEVSGTYSNAMSILPNGNIGIGTTTPGTGYKLNVNGKTLVNEFQYTKAINYSSGDLNSLVIAGFYDGSGMTNAPNGGWFYVTVEKYSGDDNWVHQTATSFGAANSPNEVYTRVRVGGIWGAWKQLGDAASVSGTTNYVSKFTGSGTTIGNSLIYDNGTSVGIGTTSIPYGNLALKSNSATSYGGFNVFANSNNKFVAINHTGTVGVIETENAGDGQSDLTIRTNGSEKMRITTGGNVGIGTTNFDLWGFGNFGGGSISHKSIVFGGNSYIGNQVGSNIAAINFGVNNVLSSPNIINRIVSVVTSTTNNSESGYLSFFTKSGAISTSSEERMRITSSGNVGIGTSSPTSRLEVYGIENSGDRTSTFNVLTVTAESNFLPYDGFGGAILFKNRAYTSGIVNSTRIKSRINNDSIHNFGGSLHFEVTPTAGGTLTEAMSIKYNGNVGIGNTNPTQKLEVDGNIKTSQSITIGLGGNYEAGSIYSDGNWGMLFRARSFSPGTANFRWSDASDNELMQISPSGAVGIGLSLIGTGPQRKLDVVGTHTTSTFRVYYPALNVAGQDASVDIWASEPGVSYYGSGIGANVNGHPYYGRTNTGLGQAFIRFVDGNMMFNTNTSDAVYSERMKITSGGNVGIGTGNPYTRLSVVQDITTTAEFGSFGQFTLQGATNPAKLLSFGFNTFTDAGFIQAMINGVSYNNLLLNARGGNVGIGTTSPATKLHVRGNVVSNRGVLCVADSSGSGSDSYPVITLYDSSDSQRADIGMFGNDFKITNYANGNLLLTTNSTERMRITSGGNVGIGTTNPSGKLDIIQSNGNGLTSDYSGIHVRQSNASVSENVAARITFNADGGTVVYGFIEQRRNASDSLALGTRNSTGSAGYVSFHTQGTEKMRISGQGNVGIGTTSPNYKLDVLINEEYQIAWRRDGVSNTWALGSDTNGTYFSNRTTSSLPLYMTNSGNVGIGTTSPSAALHVSKNIGAGEYVAYIQNTGAGNGLKIYNGDWDVSDYLLYTTNGGTAANGYAFVVDGNGKVGIGQTSPTKLLSLKRGGICGIELDDSSAVTDIQSVGGRFIIDTPSQAYIDIASSNQLYVDALSVGVHTAAPDPSAALDVTSTTQGFLPPRMSDTEMNSIAAPAAGLIVWNYDSPALFVFDGGSWRKIDMI
jgi:hypothetical protein